MIELEPVGEHRVIVPTSGDYITVCPVCGQRRSTFVVADIVQGQLREDVIASHARLGCCGEDLVVRRVP